jgi:hypothetical protein
MGGGGWVKYSSPTHTLFVRCVERDDRLVPVELLTADEAGLRTAAFRKLPLFRIEAWVNQPETSEVICRRMSEPAPDPRAELEAQITRRVVQGKVAGHIGLSGGLTVEPAGRPPDANLDVPLARPYGDEFYRQVTAVYERLAKTERNPSTLIAADNNVPVTTAHRWIREARRRGFLAPGKAGRPG